MLNRKFGCILYLFVVPVFVVGCSRPVPEKNIITVTIPPLHYLAGKIVGDDFEIVTLLPPGSTPETYEPTPSQMTGIYGSRMVFATGLMGFEAELEGKLSEKHDVVVLGESVGQVCDDGHHGIDPHIWTSPAMLSKMAGIMYGEIKRQFPDSTEYDRNFVLLMDSIGLVDRDIRAMVDSSSHCAFLIYHPALGYYARDYGLEQIALENDGKEPSAAVMSEVVNAVRGKGITKVLYQSQLNASVVEALVTEAGLEPVEFDPLSGNVLGNLLYLTRIITAE